MGPLPAMDTHTKLEAVDIKELQEEEKPNFSGKSLPKKKNQNQKQTNKKKPNTPQKYSLHQHTLPPPHPRENKTKQKKNQTERKCTANRHNLEDF